LDTGRRTRGGTLLSGKQWTRLTYAGQARYFKAVLREADHLKKVKRMRVSEKDIASLQPHYEVGFDVLPMCAANRAAGCPWAIEGCICEIAQHDSLMQGCRTPPETLVFFWSPRHAASHEVPVQTNTMIGYKEIRFFPNSHKCLHI
jgi:hypothetical protein